MLTASLVLTYMLISRDVFSDLNTYLVGFYLMMLILSYFIPKGLPAEQDSFSSEEDNPFMFSASLKAES